MCYYNSHETVGDHIHSHSFLFISRFVSKWEYGQYYLLFFCSSYMVAFRFLLRCQLLFFFIHVVFFRAHSFFFCGDVTYSYSNECNFTCTVERNEKLTQNSTNNLYRIERKNKHCIVTCVKAAYFYISIVLDIFTQWEKIAPSQRNFHHAVFIHENCKEIVLFHQLLHSARKKYTINH